MSYYRRPAFYSNGRPYYRPSGPSKPIVNNYGGRCTVCRTWVGERQGLASRVGGKWLVTHANVTECLERKAAVENEAPVTVEAQVERPAPAPRPNRYAGKCVRCTERVEERAGFASLGDNGKWQVTCADESCAADLPNVPEGNYAVPSASGNNDLDFYAITRPVKGKLAGQTVVKRVIGGRPASRVRKAEAKRAIETVLFAGPVLASATYGQAIGRCGLCNTHLTDEESRAQGFGPDCIQKVELRLAA